MYKILDNIDGPASIRSLDTGTLKVLCEEIRDYIIHCCSTNPGHLASSLGAVELIVGLHHVYDSEKDRFIFDVGHQAYAHKILTDRKESFIRNRTAGGISGFPNRDESPYDAFGTGHASTSISAALGFAEAARIRGTDEKVVAVIGDGAMTGGLALEGLNNSGNSGTDMLVILNDNEMAIDGNTGGLHSYLLNLTTDPAYNKIKNHIWQKLGAGKVRKKIQYIVRNAKKGLIVKSGGDLFEAFGLRYFGPVDGNNITEVVNALQRLKEIKGPKLLHVLTLKGKGFTPAEEDPTTWHAPGRFDPSTGEIAAREYPASRYQDVFGEILCELAAKDPAVVGITPAMATGSGMTRFAGKFPDRFFDVGIAEEHAVTFAAGLAAGGMKPYCSIYSSFAQRSFDQIIHDVALQHLPVVLCFDRAGLVGEDGATHQGVFDMASLRCVPGVTIAAPRDENELKDMMYGCLNIAEGPYIIRYPRGIGEGVDWESHSPAGVARGRGSKLCDGEKVAILGLGPVVNRACEAAERIRRETGKGPAVFDMRFLKPLDMEIIGEAMGFDVILTIEEGSIMGGLYSAVSELVASRQGGPVVEGLGVPDSFMTQDSQHNQREKCMLDSEGIYSRTVKYFKESGGNSEKS